MNNLLLCGAAFSLMLSLLILSKRNKEACDYILSVYLTIMATHIILHLLETYNFTHNYRYPGLILSSCPLALLHAPVYYLYTQTLICPNYKINFSTLLHMVPFVFMVTVLYNTVYRLPTDQKIAVIQQELFTSWISYKICITLIILSSVSYTFLCLNLLKQHKKRIKKRYSYIKNLELRWLRVFFIGMLVLVLLTTIIQSLKISIGTFSFRQQMNIIFILLSLFAFYIGFFGIMETHIFTNVRFVETDLHKVIRSTDKYANENMEYNTLVDKIHNERLYQDSELTVLKLAQQVNIPVNRLSKLIHSHAKMNFFDFINHFRIEHFKVNCNGNLKSNASISTMAFESGFNSKTTFNRAFRKKENVTPSEYIQLSDEKV